MNTIAFLVYPGMTPLDLVGPLQVLTPLPGHRVVTVAERIEPAETDTPLRLLASHTFADVPEPWAVIVPGGDVPTLRALTDETLLGYLRGAAATAEIVASVCTGSLLLAAAGLLDGRRATSHWAFRHLLTRFGAESVAERWVSDGRFHTAAGVSAGIDLALHLAEHIAGTETARAIQLGIEYDPQPPLGGIDWTAFDGREWAERSLQTALAEHPELLARLMPDGTEGNGMELSSFGHIAET
jgi:transcriptional regulator GlxA family with amidase domain